MSGSTGYNFSPNITARSSEVNQNFEWFRGHYLPVSQSSTWANTNSVYDLGSSAYHWRKAYFNSVPSNCSFSGTVTFNTTTVFNGISTYNTSTTFNGVSTFNTSTNFLGTITSDVTIAKATPFFHIGSTDNSIASIHLYTSGGAGKYLRINPSNNYLEHVNAAGSAVISSESDTGVKISGGVPLERLVTSNYSTSVFSASDTMTGGIVPRSRSILTTTSVTTITSAKFSITTATIGTINLGNVTAGQRLEFIAYIIAAASGTASPVGIHFGKNSGTGDMNTYGVADGTSTNYTYITNTTGFIYQFVTVARVSITGTLVLDWYGSKDAAGGYINGSSAIVATVYHV